MFDMKSLTTRYFEVRLQNGLKLDVEPPKIKALKKILTLTRVDGEFNEATLSDLVEGVSLVLSKNKQSKTITVEFITNEFDLAAMQSLLVEYFKWVGEIQNSKN